MTPIKTLVTIYKPIWNVTSSRIRFRQQGPGSVYLCEKELNCVKASAKLFQQLHPNTILYEANGYNYTTISLPAIAKSGLILDTIFKERPIGNLICYMRILCQEQQQETLQVLFTNGAILKTKDFHYFVRLFFHRRYGKSEPLNV